MEWIPRSPDSKEGQIFLQWLEWRLVFISQDKVTSESSVQSLEKALGPCFIWRVGHTSLDTSRGRLISMLQKVTMTDSS